MSITSCPEPPPPCSRISFLRSPATPSHRDPKKNRQWIGNPPRGDNGPEDLRVIAPFERWGLQG